VNGANIAASEHGFNGKEFNEELGLDWYDYGVRNCDSALGRWMNIDPLAD
jgi:RHS repeat-associated protein